MVNTCCVPECKSGYKSAKSQNEKIQLFRFPTDASLQKQWISSIPRSNWKLTANHRVCSKHFTPDDFITSSNAPVESLPVTWYPCEECV